MSASMMNNTNTSNNSSTRHRQYNAPHHHRGQSGSGASSGTRQQRKSGNNNSNAHSSGDGPTLSLHDPEFRNLITVPLTAVHHLPPAHLEISRLVLCRKYDPREPEDSCSMGDSCKFVHIDMSTPQLQVQSIHVNYAYRSLEEVSIDRLPAGEMLSVMAPNNRAPSQFVPSEYILVTKGALQRHHPKALPLSHCAHYFYNRMCNRGDRCGFLHCAYVDETATDFQRAPPRAGASHSQPTAVPTAAVAEHQHQQPHHHHHPQQHQQQQEAHLRTQPHSHNGTAAVAAAAPAAHHVPTLRTRSHSRLEKTCTSSNGDDAISSCDLSESPRSSHNGQNGHSIHGGDSMMQLESAGNNTTTGGSSSSFYGVPATTAHSPATAGAGTATSSYGFTSSSAYRHNPYSLIETTLVVAV